MGVLILALVAILIVQTKIYQAIEVFEKPTEGKCMLRIVFPQAEELEFITVDVEYSSKETDGAITIRIPNQDSTLSQNVIINAIESRYKSATRGFAALLLISERIKESSDSWKLLTNVVSTNPTSAFNFEITGELIEIAQMVHVKRVEVDMKSRFLGVESSIGVLRKAKDSLLVLLEQDIFLQLSSNLVLGMRLISYSLSLNLVIDARATYSEFKLTSNTKQTLVFTSPFTPFMPKCPLLTTYNVWKFLQITKPGNRTVMEIDSDMEFCSMMYVEVHLREPNSIVPNSNTKQSDEHNSLIERKNAPYPEVSVPQISEKFLCLGLQEFSGRWSRLNLILESQQIFSKLSSDELTRSTLITAEFILCIRVVEIEEFRNKLSFPYTLTFLFDIQPIVPSQSYTALNYGRAETYELIIVAIPKYSVTVNQMAGCVVEFGSGDMWNDQVSSCFTLTIDFSIAEGGLRKTFQNTIPNGENEESTNFIFIYHDTNSQEMEINGKLVLSAKVVDDNNLSSLDVVIHRTTLLSRLIYAHLVKYINMEIIKIPNKTSKEISWREEIIIFVGIREIESGDIWIPVLLQENISSDLENFVRISPFKAQVNLDPEVNGSYMLHLDANEQNFEEGSTYFTKLKYLLEFEHQLTVFIELQWMTDRLFRSKTTHLLQCFGVLTEYDGNEIILMPRIQYQNIKHNMEDIMGINLKSEKKISIHKKLTKGIKFKYEDVKMYSTLVVEKKKRGSEDFIYIKFRGEMNKL